MGPINAEVKYLLAVRAGYILDSGGLKRRPRVPMAQAVMQTGYTRLAGAAFYGSTVLMRTALSPQRASSRGCGGV